MEAKIWSDVFNARNLTPSQVAETFVINDAFKRLQSLNHSILLGPRGSGKTTLLKMLTEEARDSWERFDDKQRLDPLSFVSVYIPTDVHWHRQLGFADTRLDRLPNYKNTIITAAVTLNVFRSLCEALKYHIARTASEGHEIETTLAKAMIAEWCLPATIPSISMVSAALSSRLSELKREANRVARTCLSEDEIGDLDSFYYLDYYSSIVAILDQYEAISDSQEHPKWALCFDELELTPDWLQNRLFSETRSSDQRIIFKLSASPLPSFVGETSPSVGQDFEAIRLWPDAGNDLHQFSEQLTSRIISSWGIDDVTPRDLFGESPVSTSSESKRVGEYQANEKLWKIFKELGTWDKSFRDYMIRNKIDPSNPEPLNDKQKDTFHRKAKPLALHRTEYSKLSESGELIPKGRKNVPNIFHGTGALYDVSDGNPRWLIGVLMEFRSIAERSEAGKIKKIRPAKQAEILTKASRQFQSLLSSIPDALATLNGKQVHVVDVLEMIGKVFFRRITTDNFTIDPPGSFKVDENISDDLEHLLKVALFHGALILVDSADAIGNGSLRGYRLRLSYMLSPVMKLPLRLYKPISLSGILEGRDLEEGDSIEQDLFSYGA